MKRDKYADPAKGTRIAITAALILGGAVAGSLVGLAITPLGKIIAGAPPATLANYLWNAAAFGLIGACTAPIAVWAAMRSVPLWRTIAEPLAGAVVGAGIGAALGSGVAFLVLIPAGALAAVARLAVVHRGHAIGSDRIIDR